MLSDAKFCIRVQNSLKSIKPFPAKCKETGDQHISWCTHAAGILISDIKVSCVAVGSPVFVPGLFSDKREKTIKPSWVKKEVVLSGGSRKIIKNLSPDGITDILRANLVFTRIPHERFG